MIWPFLKKLSIIWAIIRIFYHMLQFLGNFGIYLAFSHFWWFGLFWITLMQIFWTWQAWVTASTKVSCRNESMKKGCRLNSAGLTKEKRKKIWPRAAKKTRPHFAPRKNDLYILINRLKFHFFHLKAGLHIPFTYAFSNLYNVLGPEKFVVTVIRAIKC